MPPVMGGCNPMYGKHATNLMKTDMRGAGSTDEPTIHLPGFRKEEIHPYARRLGLNGFFIPWLLRLISMRVHGKMAG